MRFARVLKITTALSALALPVASHALDDVSVARRDTVVAVTWASSTPVDVFLSYKPDATVKTAKRVSRADTDGQFEMADTGKLRPYFLLRDTSTGTTVRVAERLIPLAQGSNFRDIGGYEAADGKHIRWGMIYRSGATPMLTSADVARVKNLGIRNMFDLRSKEERAMAPTRLTGIRYASVDYSMMKMMGENRAMTNGVALYHNFPAFFAPQLKILFQDLIQKKGPLVYNCSAGQDRTGYATAIILSALGVSRETITADYHLSTTYRQPQFEVPKIDAAMAKTSPVAAMFAAYQKNGTYSKPQPLKDETGQSFLSGAFAEIDSRWGSVDAYLEQEVGITKADIARLRALYLE